MKKKSVFLMSASAMIFSAGCNETVELTGIAVLKSSIAMPCSEEILFVTMAPENAGNESAVTISSTNAMLGIFDNRYGRIWSFY
jgi:hypothetical protein